jgi:hypothetical protein
MSGIKYVAQKGKKMGGNHNPPPPPLQEVADVAAFRSPADLANVLAQPNDPEPEPEQPG